MSTGDFGEGRSFKRFNYPQRQLGAEYRNQMTRHRDDGAAPVKGLRFAIDAGEELNPFALVFDLLDSCIRYDGNLRTDGFRNAVNSIAQVPKSTAKSVPNSLHEDGPPNRDQDASHWCAQTR